MQLLRVAWGFPSFSVFGMHFLFASIEILETFFVQQVMDTFCMYFARILRVAYEPTAASRPLFAKRDESQNPAHKVSPNDETNLHHFSAKNLCILSAWKRRSAV